MIIKTEQVKEVLYNNELTGYFLEKSGIGITRQAISQLRNKGVENFEKLPLETIMKIQKWIDDGNYKFSYDYSELLEELISDYEEGIKALELFKKNPVTHSIDDIINEMERFNEIF